jgi:hypothetical protein
MLRPQFLRRHPNAAPSVGARLAQIQMAAETGTLSGDELRRAVYTLVGLPPAFGQAPAARDERAHLPRSAVRHPRHVRAS